MSEEEWDRCWSANVKVPKTLLSEARATFDANPDGGLIITTGSIAVRRRSLSMFLARTGKHLLTG